MGLLFSTLTSAIAALGLGGQKAKIFLLGLDAAGKTTILYRLKLNKTLVVIPTNGFNVEDVTPCKNVTFTMWDTGYREKIQPLLRHYFPGTDGVLFVVDSSDTARINQAREVLFSTFEDDALEKGVPVVILANKQDLPNALKSSDLVEKLHLNELSNPWHLQEMCALTGDGLSDGITALADMVKTFQEKRGNSQKN